MTGDLLQLAGPLKVIEIGTSYGQNLKEFVPFTSASLHVDPMYEWVPDLGEDVKFDHKLVDDKKLDEWYKNMDECQVSLDHLLCIGSSFEIHEKDWFIERASGSDILIIDGCHHPLQAVKNDYLNFRKFMNNPHYVVWDDMQEGDCVGAADQIRDQLISEGYSVAERTINNVRVQYIHAP